MLLSAWLISHAGQPARADEFQPVRNSFGTVGLIDTPSARMAPDGELSFSADYFQNTQRYDLGFQALPWLEADIRYAGLGKFDPNYPVYWDRSFAMKVRLWQESDLLPAVAVGINDLVGTGIYSGEYFVGSKRFGNLDFNLGIGWGRLAGAAQFKNPFSLIFPSFGNPRPATSAAGGFNSGVFFHGPESGIFGGVVWQTPVRNLSLIAEYSSDAYTLEGRTGNFHPLNQLNYGVSYRATDSVAFSLDWLYGRSIGGNISFDMDPTRDSYPQRIGSPLPPTPPTRSARQQQEALDLIHGRRRTSSFAPPEQFASNGELVDSLWRENGDLVDVEIQGRRLALRVARGNLADVCRMAARTIGLYSVTITTVTVSSSSNRLSCPVPTSPAVALLTPSVPSGPDAVMFSPIVPAGFITIDAVVEPEPDAKVAVARIRADSSQQHIIIDAIDISGAELVVYYSNLNYFSETNALDRLVRLLMTAAPPQVEKFRLIAVLGGVPQREFDILRAPAERGFAQDGRLDFMNTVSSNPAPLQNPVLSVAEEATYPKFSWDIFPQFRQQLFDPSDPFAVQFIAAAAASAEVRPGFSLNSEVEANIWNNFDVNRLSDSVLPHVRTDWAKYFTEGKNGIGLLDTEYRFRLTPEVFAIAKAGYLESMFAGLGGEVLWRPEGERWALDGDLYEVQQRNFDRLFGLQSYRVLTGHISLYYASPWYDLDFLVRAGQYLAHDRGLTVQISRRFSTGVEVGAFFTKTNVSSAQFGEGSFDKGIVIRIPIGWSLPIDTQTELTTVLRPIQRDGGQTLLGDATLYEETRRTSEDELVRQESEIGAR